jgi:hypothetical protein
MATATVVLTGLVYLSIATTPSSLRAVLMQSEHERVSTHGGTIPRHHAFISVSASSVVTGAATNRDPDFVVNNTPTDPTTLTNVYILQNESVALSGFDKASNPLQFPTPSISTSASFAAGVPKVGEFCPTCRPYSAADLDAPDLRHVGGRMDLTNGTVISTAITANCTWSFAAEFGYPAFVQTKVAKQVEVSYKLAIGERLVINTTPLPGTKTGAKPSKITFLPDAKVTIGSSSIADLVDAHVHPVVVSDHTDHHFELYYYLLERSNAAKHPLPEASSACPSPHRVGGVDCPPVQQ